MTLARLVLPILLAGSAGVAHAQSAAAEVLFREARTLIKAGKLAEGCAKFDASARIEPSVGTLLNLGDCRDKLGMRASAWVAFRKAQDVAKRSNDPTNGSREKEARLRADALEGRLARIVIRVDGKVDGLVVRRSNEVVDVALWGTPVPVDAGTYTLVAEAPGYQTWRGQVIVDHSTKTQTVVIPMLARAAVSTTITPSIVTPPPQAFITTTRPGDPWTTPRKVGVAFAIAGLAAAGTGVYFGLRSDDLAEKADARCPRSTCADQQALAWTSEAKRDARRANALYIGGGVGLAAAAVLWIAGAPSDETVLVPTAGSDRVGVSLSGRF